MVTPWLIFLCSCRQWIRFFERLSFHGFIRLSPITAPP